MEYLADTVAENRRKAIEDSSRAIKENQEAQQASLQQAAENEIRSLLPSAQTMLLKQGVHPTVARWWGLGMDTMLDPFSATMPALKAARAGMGKQAAMLMAGDHGLPALITGAGEIGRALDDEGY
jgi:hypothetical protein